MVVILPIEGLAKTPAQRTITLRKKRKDAYQDLEPIGVRIPSHPFIATISKDSFESDINPDDIMSYEIWDENHVMCMQSYTGQSSFCQYLFCNPNNYKIIITTLDYIYIGYISTI